MAPMRELQKIDQVAFWSVPEVRAALDRLTSAMRRVHRLRFRERVVTQQQLLNALILYADGLDEQSRLELVTTGLERLRTILEQDAGPLHSFHDHTDPSPTDGRRKRGA